MKAARIHRFGPPEVVVIDEVATPVPGRGEILVRTEAAGCGNWDSLVRKGQSALSPPLPLTLGSEFSGVVEAVGETVHGFDLANLGALIADGELHTRVGAVLPLGAAREAHEMLDDLRPRPRGKIVLDVLLRP